MKDIRFLGTEGEFLLLEDSGGQKFRLLLDSSLRATIKSEKLEKPTEVVISPRQIQEEIRVGRTIAEIVNATGASEGFVRKFAQPVLDELNHAVLNALTVRLEVAGDRFTEPSAREFGDIIKTRLAASGAGIETWTAFKAPNHGFYIHCEFELEGKVKKATWTYDPRRLALAPENDLALTLSSQEKIGKEAKTPLRSAVSADAGVTANLANTVDVASTLPRVSSKAPKKQLSENNESPISETADLLDALRKKRLERESSVANLEQHPSTEGLRVVEIEVPHQSEETNNENLGSPESGSSAQETSSPKKGRASIPSWDEIVFGTKKDD